MEEQKAAEVWAKLRALRKWNEEQGRFVVEAWEASGETMKAFGKRVGIWPQRVYWWRERLRRTDAGETCAPATRSTPRFVPMVMHDDRTDAGETSAPPTELPPRFVPMVMHDEDEEPLEPPGAEFTAAAVSEATAVTVVVSPDVRIEVTVLDATSAAWVAALVKSLREVSP